MTHPLRPPRHQCLTGVDPDSEAWTDPRPPSDWATPGSGGHGRGLSRTGPEARTRCRSQTETL